MGLTKLVEVQNDKEIYIIGNSGEYLYFIYDANYPDLSQIIDGNGNNIITFFSQSVLSLSSPQSYWSNKLFKVYKRQIITPIGPPTVKYQFRY